MARRRYVIRDRQTATWLGAALVAAGTYLLWEAYEARGQQKPFALRFVPGL